MSESHSVVSDSLRPQARILEWVAFPFFKGSSQPRDRTQEEILGGNCLLWTGMGCLKLGGIGVNLHFAMGHLSPFRVSRLYSL